MALETPTIPPPPWTPEQTLDVFTQMRDWIVKIGETYAANYRPTKDPKGYPWVSLRTIRITASASLGASVYNGRIQQDVDGFNFDPTAGLVMGDLYQDENSADDCYVLDIAANGVPSGVHRLKGDGSVYVIGWFKRYVQDANGKDVPLFQAVSIATATILPCTLSQNGGANGSNGDGTPGNPPTQATYTYDIIDTDGNLIASRVAIRGARQYGHVAPATTGTYYGDFNSNWHIVDYDEVIDAGGCTPP